MSTLNLQQARAELSQFVAHQPESKPGNPFGWRTSMNGPLTAAELSARIALASTYPPAKLLAEAQRWGHTTDLVIEARPDLDRAGFLREFYGADVPTQLSTWQEVTEDEVADIVAARASIKLEVTSVLPAASQPGGTSDVTKFLYGEPDGPVGTQPWRTPQGPLTAGEHATRKDFTTKHPSKVADALMARHNVDLDTVVASSAALNRRGYIDRFHKPETRGNNTGAPVVPQAKQQIGMAAPAGQTVEQALLGLLETQVERNRLNLQAQAQDAGIV